MGRWYTWFPEQNCKTIVCTLIQFGISLVVPFDCHIDQTSLITCLTCLDYLKIKKCSLKCINIRNTSTKSIEELNNYLIQQNIMTKLDPNADANTNYNTMAQILELGIYRFMPNKTIQFCKYKHKKSNWISKGVIKWEKHPSTIHHMTKKNSIYVHTIKYLQKLSGKQNISTTTIFLLNSKMTLKILGLQLRYNKW